MVIPRADYTSGAVTETLEAGWSSSDKITITVVFNIVPYAGL